jgi:hypothetical protein
MQVLKGMLMPNIYPRKLDHFLNKINTPKAVNVHGFFHSWHIKMFTFFYYSRLN